MKTKLSGLQLDGTLTLKDGETGAGDQKNKKEVKFVPVEEKDSEIF